MTQNEFLGEGYAPVSVTLRGPLEDQNFESHWAGGFFQAHLLSDLGKKRTRNEDACILCAPDAPNLAEERGYLFAVADGMGGASSGDFASRVALDIIVDEYYHGPSNNICLRLRDALENANQRIFIESEANPDRHGMGTTVSVLVIRGNCAYVAQVGDSRVYVARPNFDLLQITHDHSLVAEQVRNGFMSPEEARNHSLKNLITRAVGIKGTVKTDLFTFKLEPGDTLLICSDGLSNLVNDEIIGAALAMDNLQGAARLLVGRALTEGGSDNITTALIRVIGNPPAYEFDPGATEATMQAPGLLGKIKKLFKK